MTKQGFLSGWRNYLNDLRSDYRLQPKATQVLFGIVIVASAWQFAFDSLRWTLAHHHQDIDGFYVAASVLRHGGNPYDYSQVESAGKVLGAELPQAVTSPITLSLFLYPLTLFSMTSAGHMWGAFSALCHLAAIAILLRTFCKTAMACAIVIFAGAVCSAYILSMSLGQVTPFIFLLLALAAAAGEAGHLTRAAIFIAIASALKIYPVAILGVFLWRDIKALLIGLTLTFILLLIPAALFPRHIFVDSIHMVLSQAGNVNTWGQNQSIAAMWYRLLVQSGDYIGIVNSPELARLCHHVSALIGGAIWFFTTLVRRRQMRFGLLLGYTILTGLLFPALTWEHYLLLALIPITVLLCCDEISSRMSHRLYLLVLLAASLVCMPFDYLRLPLARGIFTLLVSIKMFGIAGLWIASTVVILKDRLAPTPRGR